jgi:MFS family permease
MSLVRSAEGLIIPAMLLGLFGAGFNTFMTNTLFQASPADERPTFVSMDSFLANIVSFVAPMLGTFLYGIIEIRIVFLIAVALRIGGTLLFWRLGVGMEKRPT